MRSIFETFNIADDGIGRTVVRADNSWRRILIGPVGGAILLSASFSEDALTDAILAVPSTTFVLVPKQMLYATVAKGAVITFISIHVSATMSDGMKHPRVKYEGDEQGLWPGDTGEPPPVSIP